MGALSTWRRSNVIIGIVVAVIFTQWFSSHNLRKSGSDSWRSRIPSLYSKSNHRSRLAIVLPFTAADLDHHLDNLESWTQLGSPCNARDAGRVDLLYYYNRVEDASSRQLFQSPRFIKAWSSLSKCFKTHSMVYAGLTDEEDVYPAGPSNMFFKLFLDSKLRKTIAPYLAIYWMEWDVFPIRQGWASQLLTEASEEEPFWQKGSIYLGRAFDDTVKYSYNWNWVSHINGNALYASDDADWRAFLELVIEQEPPNHYWKPFDVSIAKVFHHLPYMWQYQQKFLSRFQYADFVYHYGFTIGDEQIQEALKTPTAFLIHGKRSSAGKVKYDNKMSDSGALQAVQWGDEVGRDMKVSVLIRSYSEDLEFSRLAATSVEHHLWNALETIIVVPEKDVSTFKKASWPARVQIVGEPELLANGDIQQKYTKLMADQYCSGDYILHLDSDTILFRTVLRKDIVWKRKPTILYAPYSQLPPASQVWKTGTSVAMGFPVAYEFSRSSCHVYHRSMYAQARSHLESTHKQPLLEFLGTRSGKNLGATLDDPTIKRLFSDFNYIGAFLYYQAPQNITWVPAYPDGRNEGVHPILPPYICQGNARLAIAQTIIDENQNAVAHLLKILQTAITSQSCAEIDAYSDGLLRHQQELRAHAKLVER